MFTQARYKLTAWYLLIIMSISILFSVVLYRVVTLELERGMRRAEMRMRASELGLPIPPGVQLHVFFVEDIESAKQRVIFWLLVVNGIILFSSAGVSYHLAGKTLQPIQMAMEEQKRFIADSSHEIKTPLTALKTTLEVALRDKKLNLSEAKQILKSGISSVDDLTALNESMLSLAKYENNGKTANVSRIDLGELIQKVVKHLTPLAKAKEIAIKYDREAYVFKGDETAVEKLLVILIENAIKYSNNKGRIEVSILPSSKHVEVQVKDNGLGISKKDLPHIFDRFYRADKSRTKNEYSGYGLGLAIAKKIVDLHKGSITVQSKEGKGSVFTVKLPLDKKGE